MKVKNLTKIYEENEKNKVKALNGINLDFGEQGLIFIVGKSGSGKSTLLNILGGIDLPTQGVVSHKNQDISSYNQKQFDAFRNSVVGLVFQEFNLFNDLTVKENIQLALELANYEISNTGVIEMLKKVEMDEFLNKFPNELSTGQKQRVAIARALIKNPDIILADEPTGSLDSETSKSIFQLLQELSNERLIIIISHDAESASQYGNRVIELKDGEVLSDSEPSYCKINSEESVSPITSKLLLKRAFKLSLKYILSRPARLIMTIIMLVLTFVSLGLIDSISKYNDIDNTISSLEDSDVTYISYDFWYHQEFEEDQIGEVRPGIYKKNIIELEESFKNVSFYPLFEDRNDFINIFYDETIKNNPFIYRPESNGYFEVNEKILDDLGIDILHGRIPVSDNEIMISKYFYEMILRFDLKNNDQTPYVINTFDDLKNKPMTAAFPYQIVGVVDTKFDLEKYASLTDIEEETILRNELDAALNYNLHRAFFVKEGLYSSDFFKEQVELDFEEPLVFDFDKNESIDTTGNTLNFYGLKKLDSTDDIIWKNGEVLDSLSANQIIISQSELVIHGDSNKIGSFNENLSNEVKRLVTLYASENYEILRQENIDGYWPFSSENDYINFVINTNDNEFDVGKDKAYFEQSAFDNIITRIYFPYMNELNAIHVFENDIYSNQYEIVGISMNTKAIVSDDTFEFFINRSKSSISYLVSSFDYPKATQKQLISLHFNEPGKTNYSIYNEITSTIDNLDSYFEDISLITTYITMGLFVFVSLFITNFVTTTIIDREKEIGILRCIGASRRDIYKIFFLETFLFIITSALISLILGIFSSDLINEIIRNKYHLVVSFIDFGIRQILIVLIIGLIIGCVSSIIPIQRINKLNPVDVIRKK